jgi:hypothetical protein
VGVLVTADRQVSLQIFSFSDLQNSDLHADAIYQGGREGNANDDPLSRLLRISNSGGFRYRKSRCA